MDLPTALVFIFLNLPVILAMAGVSLWLIFKLFRWGTSPLERIFGQVMACSVAVLLVAFIIYAVINLLSFGLGDPFVRQGIALESWL